LTSANGSGQGPISNATAGSSEACVAGSRTETSPVMSWQGSSSFSRRVEKLVTARRAAATTLTSPTTMGTEAKNCAVPVDKGEPEVPLFILNQPHLRAAAAAPTSSPSIECPLSITSSSSQMVMSDGGTTVASSLSGSVRSRVAELEGRAAVASRTNFIRVSRRIM
jgi:hypothetical protein